MTRIMKNIGKRVSSLCCCLFIFLITTTGLERGINYYLYSIEEKPFEHIFIAYKYAVETDGRTRVEEYRYLAKDDTLSLKKISYFHVTGSSLIRYFYDDMIGQTYLKFQLDTSIVFDYMDPILNDSVTSCYLGKYVLNENGSKNELHKFRIQKYGVVSYIYLHDDFLLERVEWTIENSHQLLERIDTSKVPISFRNNVENYISDRELEDREKEGRVSGVNDVETCLGANFKFVASFAGLLLLIVCIFYLFRNKRRHTRNEIS